MSIVSRRNWLITAASLVATLVSSSPGIARQDDREKRERVADILAELGARDGAHIGDVGSADGFYSLRIARAVAPSGRAYAVDIDAKLLDKLRETAKQDGIANVDVIHGEPADPKLPAEQLDAVLIRNTYHEMTEHRSVLKAVMSSLKPGGLLVVIEGITDNLLSSPREQQVKEHYIGPEIVSAELREAGFTIVKRDDAFTRFTRPSSGGFWMIVARAAKQQPRLVNVVAGGAFGCVLSDDGSAHCWGANDKGQLGIGSTDVSNHGIERVVGGHRFESLRAGHNTVCGVTAAGDAFCWGAGDWAQLGSGRYGHSATPVAVAGDLKFQTVVPGGTLTCGITLGGELYCWGGNNHGQLGVGNKDGDPDTSCCYKRPQRIAAGRLFKAVTAGGVHACAVDINGKGYCWGYQHDGRLGNGEPGTARNVPDLPSPVPINSNAVLTTVAGRSWHTCSLTALSELLCWGLGEHGRLGSGSMESQPVPMPVKTPSPFRSFPSAAATVAE